MLPKKIAFAIAFFSLFFIGCKPKKSFTSYFDEIAEHHGLKAIKTKPVSEKDAKIDIVDFFSKVKPENPKTKCFVDIENIEGLLERLKPMGASGIRLYSAAYTTESVKEAHSMGMTKIRLGDYHLILVPIDKDGKEIKSEDIEGKAVSTIMNYNNDCPYTCPNATDWEKITLINEMNRESCNF